MIADYFYEVKNKKYAADGSDLESIDKNKSLYLLQNKGLEVGEKDTVFSKLAQDEPKPEVPKPSKL